MHHQIISNGMGSEIQENCMTITCAKSREVGQPEGTARNLLALLEPLVHGNKNQDLYIFNLIQQISIEDLL